MSKNKPYPTWDRLSSTWIVLYDLAELPEKQMPTKDRCVLEEARHIVNRIQVRVYDQEKKKTVDALTATARKKDGNGQAITD